LPLGRQPQAPHSHRRSSLLWINMMWDFKEQDALIVAGNLLLSVAKSVSKPTIPTVLINRRKSGQAPPQWPRAEARSGLSRVLVAGWVIFPKVQNRRYAPLIHVGSVGVGLHQLVFHWFASLFNILSEQSYRSTSKPSASRPIKRTKHE
jgi:hypothetical protein